MTRPNNSTLKNVTFYAACFTYSVALFVALAAAGHVYPFGDNSFLTNDLKYQYIDFFAWFRRVLFRRGKPSLFLLTGTRHEHMGAL